MPIRISQEEEVELLKATKFLEETADRLPDIVALLDRDLRHLFVNKVIEEITGLTRQDYLGKTNRELGMPENLCQIWDSTFAKTFETGEALDVEFEFNGTHTFQAKTVPQKDSTGTVHSILVITRDITKLKKQQDSLVRSASNSSIHHLCRELSHHLNNPLAIMMTQLEFIKKTDSYQSDIKIQKHLQNLESSASRIHETVQNILKITEAFEPETHEAQKFSLKEGVLMAQSLCLENQEHGNPDFDIKIHGDCQIHGSLADFVEATFQILKNAVQAASLSKTPWVRVEGDCDGQKARIRIIDSGKFDQQIMDPLKIFLPFFTTKGPSAKGLGINIAQENLRRMGGRLFFEKTAPQTTFIFEVPVKNK